MFQARRYSEIETIRSAVERVGKLSDGVIGVGPLKIGLDGILAWVPLVGSVYSIGAGLMLLTQGWRAHVPVSGMAQIFTLLTVRTAVTAGGEAASVLTLLPITIPAELAVDFFRAHKWSADIIIKAIDNTVYVEGRKHPSNPDYVEMRQRVRSGAEKRRVVFLG